MRRSICISSFLVLFLCWSLLFGGCMAKFASDSTRMHIGRCAVSNATLVGLDRVALFTGLKRLYVAELGSAEIDCCRVEKAKLSELQRDESWTELAGGQDVFGALRGGEDASGPISCVYKAFCPKCVNVGEMHDGIESGGDWPATCNGYRWVQGGTRYLLLEIRFWNSINTAARRLVAFKVDGSECSKSFDCYLPFQRLGSGWRTDGKHLYVESLDFRFRIRLGSGTRAALSAEWMPGVCVPIGFAHCANRSFDLKIDYPKEVREYSGHEVRLGARSRFRVRLRHKNTGMSVDEQLILTCVMTDNCYRESCGELGCCVKETWCSGVIKEASGHEKASLVILYCNVVFDTSCEKTASLATWRKVEAATEWAAVDGNTAVAVQEVNDCVYVYVYNMLSIE